MLHAQKIGVPGPIPSVIFNVACSKDRGSLGTRLGYCCHWLPLIYRHVQCCHTLLSITCICADNHDVIAVRVYDVDVESKDEGAAVEVCP